MVRLFCGTFLASTLLACGTVTPARTSTPEAKVKARQRVALTGSKIYGRLGKVRKSKDTPNNLVVIDRDDIRNAGGSMGQALLRASPVITRR